MTNLSEEEIISSLREKASAAKSMNWAPYSEFVVLAAVMTSDGRFYGGSNIENAGLTLTKHAEEVASILAIGDGALERLGRKWMAAVYVEAASDSGPCGGCRQFLQEFATDEAYWFACDTNSGETTTHRFKELMPFPFGPEHLGL